MTNSSSRDRTHLRGAMIGAGAWSEVQLTGWANVSGARIVALVDRHPERRDRVAGQFDIERGYDNISAMLDTEQIDFVDVCVRPRSQFPLIQEVADRRLHVLCQKPFCESINEAHEAVAYCKRAGVRLMINENFRWQQRFRRTAQIIAEGGIGRPFSTHIYDRQSYTRPPFEHPQTYFREMERLLMFEMGVHYIDSLRFLFGEPRHLFAHTQRVSPDIRGEDTMHLFFAFDKGTSATVDSTWSAFPEECFGAGRFQMVEGTEGACYVDFEQKLHLVNDAGHTVEQLHDLPDRDFVRRCQQHFVDCLVSGVGFETPGSDYLRTMAIMHECYESAEHGETVPLGVL